MAETRVKTLFNRNHILFRTYEGDFPFHKEGFHTVVSDKKPNVVVLKKPIKKESPLGFWYLSRKPKKLTTEGSYKSKTILAYMIKDTIYELSYYTQCDDVTVGVDMHPWEIISGDGGMPQSQIDALRCIVERIYGDLTAYKKSLGSYDPASVKRWLNQDLFGDPRGIKMQTDEEKILSHGFDTKISFRNRKET